MKTYEFSGKTVEKAIEQGLKELKKNRDDVDISIISQGGLFSKAKVEISFDENEENFEESLKDIIGEEIREDNDEKTNFEAKNEDFSNSNLENSCKLDEEANNSLENDQENEQNQLDSEEFLGCDCGCGHGAICTCGDDCSCEDCACENCNCDEENNENFDKSNKEVEKIDENKQKITEIEEKSTKKVMSSEEVFDKVQEIFSNIFKCLNINGRVMTMENDDTYEVKISGDENIGSLIGYRGEALNAYQVLLNSFTDLKYKSKKILLDVEGYRSKREESLNGLAIRIAKKVLRTKKRYKFEPMSSYERHVIHEALAGYKGVTTHSEGVEPRRCLIVELEKEN